MTHHAPYDFDFLIVGSGFGGSVSACRLAEKGYSVAVMEMGRRWNAEDFPKNNWNTRRWVWRPGLKLFGFFNMRPFRHYIPFTAHCMGGCAIARTPDRGVIDPQNRVFNYKNLYVVDGSMLGANLGVNPSLTITALAERAMSFIPPRGDRP